MSTDEVRVWQRRLAVDDTCQVCELEDVVVIGSYQFARLPNGLVLVDAVEIAAIVLVYLAFHLYMSFRKSRQPSKPYCLTVVEPMPVPQVITLPMTFNKI